MSLPPVPGSPAGPTEASRTGADTGADAGSEILAHPAVQRVAAVLAGTPRPGRIVVLGEHARTAAAAAEQLGVTVAQIANSLVFAVPDPTQPEGRRHVLVMTSGAHRVDPAKVAALLGVASLDRADAEFVRQTTGFVIGGVPPVAHLAAPQTVVDRSLADHDEVWAAAGHARTVFPTTFDELLALTGGIAAEVA